MNINELRPGMEVIAEVRNQSKEAVVRRVPPFTETVAGVEREVTDEVCVQYPNTSIDGGDFFGDMQENVPIEDIKRK